MSRLQFNGDTVFIHYGDANNQPMTTVSYKIDDIYLDWFNNFLTIGRFAEYYGITEDQAGQIIDYAR